jgi:hypothetical protein
VRLETVDPGSAAEHQRREGRNCCKYAPHRFTPPSDIEVALEVDWQWALLKGPSERILDGNSPKDDAREPRSRSVPSAAVGSRTRRALHLLLLTAWQERRSPQIGHQRSKHGKPTTQVQGPTGCARSRALALNEREVFV